MSAKPESEDAFSQAASCSLQQRWEQMKAGVLFPAKREGADMSDTMVVIHRSTFPHGKHISHCY